MTDAVVVGAGPAGSATALLLARAGWTVRIVERARFPRRKVCGEYLGGGAVAALERLGVLDAVRAVATPLHGVTLVADGAPPVTLAFDAPALACARETLDALLLEAALAAGASVERARVEELLFARGRCVGVRARREDGALVEREARVVIGADGCGSLVARKLGVTREPARGARYAVGGHYGGLARLDGRVEMQVRAGAYLAFNPLSSQCTNVIAVVPKADLARWSGALPDAVGAPRVGPRVAVGPLAHAVRTPVRAGALLVGDAAGLVDPFTGQGVFLALAGAEHAADALARGDLAAYARWRVADARRRARLCAAVKLLVETPPLARRAAARLARFPERASALLAALAGLAPPSRFELALLGKLLA